VLREANQPFGPVQRDAEIALSDKSVGVSMSFYALNEAVIRFAHTFAEGFAGAVRHATRRHRTRRGRRPTRRIHDGSGA
jgi:hypothetical protein